MSGEHFLYYVAVYAIIRKENKILLARRFNTGWMDGMYTLPAGHVDGNETAEAAMSREMKEKTNLDIDHKDLSILHVMQRHGGNREYIDYYFEAKNWKGTAKNNEPDKCDHLDWFDVDALPDNTIPNVTFALERIAAKQPFSSFGYKT